MKQVFVNPKLNWIVFSIVVLISIVISSSTFTILEGEQASAFLFGQAKRDYVTPGFHTKYPWESINKVDKRLMLHSARALTLQEKTKKKLLIDYFCLFRIDNPKTYFTKVISMDKAKHRIDDHLGSDIASEIGRNIFEDIVTNKRQSLLDIIRLSSNKGLDDIDLSIKFLSFNRVELPDENKKAVFADMIADRKKISDGYIAEGTRISDSIKSYADYQATDILTTAKKQAAIMMGTADSLRLHKLNRAYAKSKTLFRLYNKIQTFEKSYAKNTEWILTPDNMVQLPK